MPHGSEMYQRVSGLIDILFTRERRGFVASMAALLFLPHVPLTLNLGQPSRSTLSLAFVALLYWAISCRFSPVWRQVVREKYHYVTLIQIVAAYQFAITLVGVHLVLILYSAQWLLYVALAVWLVSGYYQLAAHLGRQRVLLHDLEMMALVYAGGLLVSLRTGPFYPWQVGWYERIGENITIVSAVGFGTGKNGAGAIMMMLAPFILFSSSQGFKRVAESILVLAGLFATFSRGSLVGLVGGLLVVLALGGFLFLAGKVCIRRSHLIVALMALITAGILAVTLGFAVAGYDSRGGYLDTVVSMIAPSSGSLFMQDLAGRAEIWRNGLSDIAGSSSREVIFGHGFRNASQIGDFFAGGASAWTSTHNSYIEFVFDFGIVGGLLMSVWWLSAMWKCLSGMMSRERGCRKTNIIAAVGMMSFAILNISETYFYGVELMVLMFVLAGLPILTAQRKSPESKECGRASISEKRVADDAL